MWHPEIKNLLAVILIALLFYPLTGTADNSHNNAPFDVPGKPDNVDNSGNSNKTPMGTVRSDDASSDDSDKPDTLIILTNLTNLKNHLWILVGLMDLRMTLLIIQSLMYPL